MLAVGLLLAMVYVHQQWRKRRVRIRRQQQREQALAVRGQAVYGMRATSPNEPPPVYTSQPLAIDALSDDEALALQLESPPAYTGADVSTDIDRAISAATDEVPSVTDNEAVVISSRIAENTERPVEPTAVARALVEAITSVAQDMEVYAHESVSAAVDHSSPSPVDHSSPSSVDQGSPSSVDHSSSP